jgi:alpha-tubulin suppressor-like RCC1 family protein
VFVLGETRSGKLGFRIPQTGNEMAMYQDNAIIHVPKMCSYNILVKQVSCGEMHTHLLSRDGYVYSMGHNWHGALGLGSNEQALRQVTSPQLVTSLKEISAVSTGKAHSLALDVDGKVYGWGKADSG